MLCVAPWWLSVRSGYNSTSSLVDVHLHLGYSPVGIVYGLVLYDAVYGGVCAAGRWLCVRGYLDDVGYDERLLFRDGSVGETTVR